MSDNPTEACAFQDVTRYLASIQKGAEWLSLLLSGNEGHAQVTVLEALYKAPMALAKVGRLIEGQNLLHRIMDRYLTDDGHFQETTVNSFSQRHCDLYQDLWLIWGAYYLGEFSVAQRCMAFVLRFFDEVNGGFRSSITTDYSNMSWELRSTALGGIGNLSMKNLGVAEMAGDFVIRMLDLQPDLFKGFYLGQDTRGNLVTNFDHKDERYFIITRDQSQPLYYALGLSTSLLAYLFLVTQKPKYLTAAERYVAVYEGYGHEIYQHHYSGKIGWGLAILYHVTKKQAYARLAIKVADYLTSLQLPTGQWHLRAIFPDLEKQPIAMTIDRTAEYIVWLTNIIHELR